MTTHLYLGAEQIFHTVEGEGPSVGKPIVFQRMSSCNLTCKGWATADNPDGCDTKKSWTERNKYTFEELATVYESKGFVKFLTRGDIWKYTGGEPLLQQNQLLEWTTFAVKRWGFIPVLEFETNATLIPSPEWSRWNARFVCSPKLASNGDAEKLRYKTDALAFHARNAQSFFKFVVRNEKDMDEVLTKYVRKFNIPASRIWLMPEGATNKEWLEKAPDVIDLCKQYGFQISPRLQVMIYGQTMGV